VTSAPRGGWSIERRTDSASTLHGPWPDPGQRGSRLVALCTVVGRRAIVLGTTQSTEVVDLARAADDDVDVVRRASGGGAVLIGPAAQVWLEAWVPRRDPLWDDDVIESSSWLGQTWTRALAELGSPGLFVHRGRATRTEWSDLICFAGVGPGEVTTAPASTSGEPAPKVVGVAQRRTREGARLHSMALVQWSPEPLVALLALDADRTRRAHDARGICELHTVAAGLRDILPMPLRGAGGETLVAAVEGALLRALP